jgi:hypothetical protein
MLIRHRQPAITRISKRNSPFIVPGGNRQSVDIEKFADIQFVFAAGADDAQFVFAAGADDLQFILPTAGA